MAQAYFKPNLNSPPAERLQNYIQLEREISTYRMKPKPLSLWYPLVGIAPLNVR